MFANSKSTARRTALHESRPDTAVCWWNRFRSSGGLVSAGIAAAFFIGAASILMLREQVLPYRPGQSVSYDIISRADFSYPDKGLLYVKQIEARDRASRVFRANKDAWQPLQDLLHDLPDRVAGATLAQLPPPLHDLLDGGALTALQRYQSPPLRARYEQSLDRYLQQLRSENLVILAAADREDDIIHDRRITLIPGNISVDAEATHTAPADEDLKARLERLVVDNFHLDLQPKILAITLANLHPTYELDTDATTEARNNAVDNIPTSDWQIRFSKNDPIVHKGVIEMRDWQVLREENRAFLATLGNAQWKGKLGLAGVTLLLTIALAAYTAHYQPRVISNHARGAAIAALLLSMLLLAQLAGIGSGPIYLFAVAPTLLVGIILSIAYDQRFALALASVHGLLVTIGLDQRVGFLLIMWVGLICAVFLLNDIRSRSKLVEVGGLAAIAMMGATVAWGCVMLDPWSYIRDNCLYVGAAGLTVGFVTLGILPFVEKAFRITTSMTLLELADVSNPLLRRLAVDAPGTYNHSLQVATLSAASAEAIGANALLCRVAAYYHDIGKINKSDYFVENQQAGQVNRHINLTPNVSFLIIKGHVADGIELARDYNLPTSIISFIQQHHGTTLVEYFYRAACSRQERSGEDAAEVSDTEYRYPGPKPKTREVAILMLADCVESATRSMPEPTASRIETLVHELMMRRLLDGQFDESELTMRDLAKVEKTLIKTLLSIYHGRIAYPSTSAIAQSNPAPSARLA
jgi:putative nucleotidyltransferase with HDIG domain